MRKSLWLPDRRLLSAYQLKARVGGAAPVQYVEHPLVRPQTLELRTYQVELAQKCVSGNTLVVLPTGLGKTAVALLTISELLRQLPEKQYLILAPTRVLVHQHYTFLRRHLNVLADRITVVTGEDPLTERQGRWRGQIICATPQICVTDAQRGFLHLQAFALVVLDEVHRAVGEYAYTVIAAQYLQANPTGRILGMTASLPSHAEQVQELVKRLNAAHVEIRDERSGDVRPYIQRTAVQWIQLELPPVLDQIRGALRRALEARLQLLAQAGLVRSNRWGSVGFRDLLALRRQVTQLRTPEARMALIAAIRLTHAVNLLETQSVAACLAFFDRLFARTRGHGVRRLQQDPDVRTAYELARGAQTLGLEHPKLEQLPRLLQTLGPDERTLVFTSYRDSVTLIHRRLADAGFRAGYLIGKSGSTGQTQREQVQAVEDLRRGRYNVLVATQVGEEGLDVAECNLVVFYDSVPSAIRFVQRRGRTGRRAPGRVVAFLTKGTRDEAYFWASRRRARDVHAMARTVAPQATGPLDTFVGANTLETSPT